MSNLISGNFPVETYRNLSLGVTGQVVKAAKGQIFDVMLTNNAASLRYVKFYDKATAALSTDTPVRTYTILANSNLAIPLGDAGVEFLLGIGLRGTTGLADNDTGAPSANDIIVNLGFM